MPSLQDIQRYMIAVWRLMNGRREGLNDLDFSADGFWNSFWAIAVTIPVFMFWWATEMGDFGAEARELSGRLSIVFRLAIADLVSWILPLVALIPATRLAGCADRLVPLVVSSNWGSALINWMFLPPMTLIHLLPDSIGIGAVLGLFLVLFYLVFAWRLFKTVIGGSIMQAAGIFTTLILLEVFVSGFMRQLVGLPIFGPEAV